MISAHKKRPHQFHRIQSTSNPPHSLREWFITLTTDVMSRSGLLGYHSGRGLLLLGVALTVTAQDGGTFSLLLVGGRARRASGLTATAPGGDVVLLIKNPPPEGSASAALPPEFLTSGILEICEKNSWATNGMKIFRTNSARLRFGSCLFQVKRKKKLPRQEIAPKKHQKTSKLRFFQLRFVLKSSNPHRFATKWPRKKNTEGFGGNEHEPTNPHKKTNQISQNSAISPSDSCRCNPPHANPIPSRRSAKDQNHTTTHQEKKIIAQRNPRKQTPPHPTKKKKNAKTTYDLLGSSPIPSDPGPAATTNSPTIESPNYGGIDP